MKTASVVALTAASLATAALAGTAAPKGKETKVEPIPLPSKTEQVQQHQQAPKGKESAPAPIKQHLGSVKEGNKTEPSKEAPAPSKEIPAPVKGSKEDSVKVPSGK